MSALVHRGEALPSLEKARAMLASAKSTHEVRKILVLAQAVKSVERGTEIGIDAAELVLDAKARGGELAQEIERTKAGRKGKYVTTGNALSRTARLDEEGLNRKEAAEWQRIAALKKSGGLTTYQKASRKASQQPSTRGAVALSKLPEPVQEQVFAKLGEKSDVRQAINQVKLDAKRELADHLRANPVVTPTGRYQVIAADPPWKYEQRTEDTTHRGKILYPAMTVEEICALPVGTYAQDNCILWLWTTNLFMRGAYRVLDAWGFEEKTILTWDKEILGLGDWLRNITEHCILAVRGRPLVDLRNQTSLIRERRREHSRKPEAFYQLVESLCPGSKLELFSRAPREGWVAWGAEPETFRAAR